MILFNETAPERRGTWIINGHSVMPLLLISLFLCVVRIVGIIHPAFQAFAHLFVGFLIGIAFVKTNRFFALMLILILSIVETIMFTIKKLG